MIPVYPEHTLRDPLHTVNAGKLYKGVLASDWLSEVSELEYRPLIP